MELLIHGLPLLLQLLAVALALYTIRISGRAVAWLLLCAALLLMVVRRALEYLAVVGVLERTAIHQAQDWIALAVSFLIAAGVYHGRKIVIARMQAEKALAESEEKFRVIASAAHDAIVQIGAEGRIEFWNAAAEKIFGYSPAEALGQSMHELIVPERFRVEAGRGFEHFMESGQGPVIGKILELPALRKGGSEFSAQHSISAVKVNGRWHAIGLIQDITERKQTEDRLKESRARLERSLRGTIDAIARLTELRDPFIEKRQQHVARLAAAIAQEMGLAEDRVEGIRLAATIHDLGLITLPFEVLAKLHDLTDAERGLYQTHPETGYAVLADIDFPWPIAAIVRQHHENLDGSGFPAGLKGDGILLEARIVNVANVLAEMVADRAAQPPVALDEALERLVAGRGSVYDPAVVDACVRLFRERGMTLA